MPAFVSVISIEGVLGASPRDSTYVQMVPIVPGQALLQGLRRVGQVVLLSNHDDRDQVEHWLRRAAMITPEDYELLQTRSHFDTDLDEVELRIRHLNRVRAVPLPINLFVDASAQVVSAAFAQGIVCLLFSHPSYMRPEHRPDVGGGKRTWDEIEEDATRQRELLTADPRRENL